MFFNVRDVPCLYAICNQLSIDIIKRKKKKLHNKEHGVICLLVLQELMMTMVMKIVRDINAIYM